MAVAHDNRTIEWLHLLLFQLMLEVVNLLNVVIMQLLQLFFRLIVAQTGSNNTLNRLTNPNFQLG